MSLRAVMSIKAQQIVSKTAYVNGQSENNSRASTLLTVHRIGIQILRILAH